MSQFICLRLFILSADICPRFLQRPYWSTVVVSSRTSFHADSSWTCSSFDGGEGVDNTAKPTPPAEKTLLEQVQTFNLHWYDILVIFIPPHGRHNLIAPSVRPSMCPNFIHVRTVTLSYIEGF
jgi:hypothetical protein